MMSMIWSSVMRPSRDGNVRYSPISWSCLSSCRNRNPRVPVSRPNVETKRCVGMWIPSLPDWESADLMTMSAGRIRVTVTPTVSGQPAGKRVPSSSACRSAASGPANAARANSPSPGV